jgi:hypothetical protein
MGEQARETPKLGVSVSLLSWELYTAIVYRSKGSPG